MNTDSKSKSLLFLDAYHEPEQIAFTHLENDLIFGLLNKGYIITIICPQPSRGVSKATHDSYKNKKVEYLFDNRLIIKRFNCRKEKSGTFRRFLRYIHINIMTLKLGKKEQNVDYIFCNSTPPTQGLVAGRLKRILEKKLNKNIFFVYNLQDLFPDSLISSRISKYTSILYNLGKHVEKMTYSYADKIVVISNRFKNILINRGVNSTKINVLYNWIDTKKINNISRKNNILLKELGLNENDKIVVYAGNFGRAQNIDVIVDASRLLESQNIKFVLFGYGPEFTRILKKTDFAINLFVYPLLPFERVSEVYSLGNVNLISCKKGFGSCSFPSKTWSILACNSPIVASYDVDSELNEILTNNKFGICVEPENSQSLAEAILSFLDVKINSRFFVENKASKKYALDFYYNIFS